MNEIAFKVEFLRYDEDVISVISSEIRYFKDPVKANKEAGEWTSKSSRNEVITTIIELE